MRGHKEKKNSNSNARLEHYIEDLFEPFKLLVVIGYMVRYILQLPPRRRGWMRDIINLTETNSSYCIPFIRLFFPYCLHFSLLSSIKKSKLPFRPQKYDIWRSNDLQAISGNVHRES